MNLERLTVKSQEALQAAQSAASEMGTPEINPEHLLHALLSQHDGLASALLSRIGVDVDRLRRRTKERLEAAPRVEGGAAPHLGDRLRALLEQAERRAESFRDDFVSVEHLLLGCVESRGPSAELLRESG